MLPLARTSLMLLLLVLLFNSCKKDSDNTGGSSTVDYYFKFTLDGSDLLYIYNAEGNLNVPTTGGKYIFTGAALKVSNIGTSNNATISISSNSQLKTGVTYVNYANSSFGYERAVLATVSFIDNAGVVFNSWGDEFASTGIISNSKINFSEITSTNLKGTFSGTVYKSISGTADKHVVTNGMFNLKRK